MAPVLGIRQKNNNKKNASLEKCHKMHMQCAFNISSNVLEAVVVNILVNFGVFVNDSTCAAGIFF